MEQNNEIRIRRLRDRYFEAETSREEEHALRGYFSGQREITADLRYAQALFGSFSTISRVATPLPGKLTDSTTAPGNGGPMTAGPSTTGHTPAPGHLTTAPLTPADIGRPLRHAEPATGQRRLRRPGRIAAAATVAAAIVVTALVGHRQPTIYCLVNAPTDYQVAEQQAIDAFELIASTIAPPRDLFNAFNQLGRSIEVVNSLPGTGPGTAGPHQPSDD